MSFAPLLGPESPSYVFVQSSVSAYLSSLAALCTSIVAATFALVDDLASRIPPSWCPRCRLRNARESCLRTEPKAAVPASDSGMKVYKLKPLEDTDSESTKIALVFYSSVGIYVLRRLEDIDVEKAIFRRGLPNWAKSFTVQLFGKTIILREILDDGTPKTRQWLKHQPSLVDGIFIIPGGTGTRTTMSTAVAREDQLPAELPATPVSAKRKQQQEQEQEQEQPVELPADEISPVMAQVVLPTPPPRLLLPRPRSPNSRKASPLLGPPPPLLRMGSSGRRSSSAISMRSGSIQIAYTPSH